MCVCVGGGGGGGGHCCGECDDLCRPFVGHESSDHHSGLSAASMIKQNLFLLLQSNDPYKTNFMLEARHACMHRHQIKETVYYRGHIAADSSVYGGVPCVRYRAGPTL